MLLRKYKNKLIKIQSLNIYNVSEIQIKKKYVILFFLQLFNMSTAKGIAFYKNKNVEGFNDFNETI